MAWRVQAATSGAASSALEYRLTGRWPAVSAAPTVSRSTTPPCTGRASGTCRVSSAIPAQPSCSAATAAISTYAVPGSSDPPSTACSDSQAGLLADSRPVNRNPAPSGSSTAAPSSGCPTG